MNVCSFTKSEAHSLGPKIKPEAYWWGNLDLLPRKSSTLVTLPLQVFYHRGCAFARDRRTPVFCSFLPSCSHEVNELPLPVCSHHAALPCHRSKGNRTVISDTDRIESNYPQRLILTRVISHCLFFGSVRARLFKNIWR